MYNLYILTILWLDSVDVKRFSHWANKKEICMMAAKHFQTNATANVNTKLVTLENSQHY